MHAGRLGSSLATAASQAGCRITAVARRSREAAERVAARLGGDVLATTDPQRVADASDVVFLTTVDDHIGDLARSIDFREGQIVIHCSGATPVAVLDDALGAGVHAGGFHPLQTFPDERGGDRFTGVTFGIEAENAEVFGWLDTLARTLGGSTIGLDAASRPLYHASAVMAGPLVAALAGLAGSLWTGFGRDRAEGVAALTPLLTSTTVHVAELGLPEAMTGPFVRGDLGPVRMHLQALGGFDPAIREAYAAVALAQLPLAAERGNIPDERLRAVRELLRDAVDQDAI